MDGAAFDSPVVAAVLSGWSPAAEPVVVSIDDRGDVAEVVLDLNGGYPYWVYLIRSGDRWIDISSQNAPFDSWPVHLRERLLEWQRRGG